ncbi:hypothetical protein PR202_gb12660 [Eleusine coracana subsp. coracana]|uniref:BHLH domain-containing protein n=1 Tax=Eleusine coracana subsp. coracana TaxID=191504 RepID=A0AAV5EPY0_ELECO|nr:hypothetical protein PR202_gb12660 [Eleusine coracana subsp. coracana]
MAASSEATHKALQAVAQGTRWTYSLLWQLCPHQGALVWAEGHYNGAIKTRKTVKPGGDDEADEDEDEEVVGPAGSSRAARRRSKQLRELYESLAREAAAATATGGGGGGGGGSTSSGSGAPATTRRPCASLAPEDLAETEWFYLMCASYCFPPGLGLRTQTNLCVDFQISIIMQTVACIPVADGVLEIGTTEKVEEDIGLIQYARGLFMDQHGRHMVPTLSGHSTSNPITYIDDRPLKMKRETYIGYTNMHQQQNHNPEDKQTEVNGDDNDQFDMECASDLEANNEFRHATLNFVSNEQATPNAGSSELMHVEASDRARYACSSYVDEEIDLQLVCQNINAQTNRLQRQDGPAQWDLVYENLCNGYLDPSVAPNFLIFPFIPTAEDQAIPPENAHYAETVLRVLKYNVQQQTASSVKTYLALSNSSSFSRWNAKSPVDLQSMMVSECTPQRMLKAILLNVSSRQFQYREGQSPEARDGEGTSRTRRGHELSASHVLKERRRREKLNERFVVLRSLVPFVTKMDRASILGDTIEYLKQLRRRIQDLESRSQQIDTAMMLPPAASRETRGYFTRSSTGMRAGEARSVSCSSSSTAMSAPGTEVQVSIIESDALLELRCPHRDGLLLRVMQAMHRDLRLEVTSVQASSAGGVLLAELRAKASTPSRLVNEVHGRRSSIAEVKRAIHLILSSD